MIYHIYQYLKKYQSQFFFLVIALVLFTGLGSAPIYILDEAKNAQAAREMMEKNEWVVPTFNNQLRSHKPPLQYYFMRMSYNIFGVNAFGARFFSAVMGLSTIWITWYFVKRFIGKAEAFWSATVLVLSTHFLFEFRLAVPDPYLIFFMAAGIFCFYAYLTEEKTGWLIFSAVAVGLAVLAKGPLALLLPGLSLFCWALFVKRSSLIFSPKILLYILIFTAITLPWYIAVHISTQGSFTRDFFLSHNLERFESPKEGHGGSILLIPLFVFGGLLPMAVFLIDSLKVRAIMKINPLWQLSVFVVFVTILFFSIAGTKLPNYPMPCYPFIAVLLGCCVNQMIKYRPTTGKLSLWFLLLVNVGLLAGAILGLSTEAALVDVNKWAFIFVIPIMATLYSLVLIYTKNLKYALYALCVCYIPFNLVALSFAYPSVYRQNPVAKTIHLLAPDEQLYAFKTYNPAYNFYTSRPIKVIHNERSLHQLFEEIPEAKVISREGELNSLSSYNVKIIAKEKDLFETPNTIIFKRSDD
jgi:4-amino-4-deoxy-L-arabinose transferase-like glycosyltransferase